MCTVFFCFFFNNNKIFHFIFVLFIFILFFVFFLFFFFVIGSDGPPCASFMKSKSFTFCCFFLKSKTTYQSNCSEDTSRSRNTVRKFKISKNKPKKTELSNPSAPATSTVAIPSIHSSALHVLFFIRKPFFLPQPQFS